LTEKLYYYSDGERALGPNTLVELATAAGTGHISSGVLVAALGDSDWRPLSSLVAREAANCGGVRSVDSRVNSEGNSPMRNDRGSLFSFIDSLTGLPRTKNLAWSAILLAIFRVHSDDDAAQAFPPQSDSVGTPWVFSRLLLGGLLAGALFYWALLQFNNTKLIPGLLFFSCVTIPFATVTFLIEMCGSSRVSGYHVAKALTVGGVISIVISLFLGELPIVAEFSFTPMVAGPVEETGKLLAVIAISRAWAHASRVRDGIVIGASVGAGFAVLETAGYIFESFVGMMDVWYESGQFDTTALTFTIVIRALFSPFCHVIWTAITAGCLWHVAQGRKLSFDCISDSRFIRIFGLVVCLHMLWNSPVDIPLLEGLTVYFGKFILLGFVGWYVLLQLLQADSESVPN
jgi:RsiW-degrading membrane proteinase PrsW (M82 family)